MISSAIVLAAGLGKRMRPITNTIPKPLVSIAGKSLLDWALGHCARAKLRPIVVNMHYLADQIEAHVTRHWPDIILSDERAQLLDTGGGVVKALPHLEGDAFFVINADNLWIDGRSGLFDAMTALWQPDKMDALLAMVPLARATGYEGAGDFSMDGLGRLARRRETRLAPFVFSGVQILKRDALVGAPDGAFSLNWVFDRALQNERLFGMAHPGRWFHVGDPAAIELAETGIAHE